MPEIPPVNSNKIVKVLEKAGFTSLRQKWSHIIMMDKRNTRIVISVHPGKDIKPGLVRATMKEAGLTREEFLRLLREK